MQRRRTLFLPEQAAPNLTAQATALPLPGRCQELLPVQQSMSRAPGRTAPKDLWGHVLAQLLHMPCHHRKTMDHNKQRDVDYFQAPENGTSHTTWGKEEKQSGDTQDSATNSLSGKNWEMCQRAGTYQWFGKKLQQGAGATHTNCALGRRPPVQLQPMLNL